LRRPKLSTGKFSARKKKKKKKKKKKEKKRRRRRRRRKEEEGSVHPSCRRLAAGSNLGEHCQMIL
jgi:hypothetical protein